MYIVRQLGIIYTICGPRIHMLFNNFFYVAGMSFLLPVAYIRQVLQRRKSAREEAEAGSILRPLLEKYQSDLVGWYAANQIHFFIFTKQNCFYFLHRWNTCRTSISLLYPTLDVATTHFRCAYNTINNATAVLHRRRFRCI